VSEPPLVLLLPGDGIGPEVVEAARRVMEAAARQFGRRLAFEEGLVGGLAVDRTGQPLPEQTLQAAWRSRAVLLGAVGGPRWDRLPGPLRPESGLLRLRKELGLFANLRPVRSLPGTEGLTPLRPEVVKGTDLVIVRELSSGLYYGPRGRREEAGQVVAYDTLEYRLAEIERVARVGFQLARARRRQLCLVDKANVLETSRLWREVVARLAGEYPDVEVSYQYVDSCALRLVAQPASFDVIVTENLFGDILSDEAAVLAGSLGMLPSASLGGPVGLYEPVHGSAPDLAGQGVANPLGAILSGAMLMEFSLGWRQEARAIERAVEEVLRAGYRTADLQPPQRGALPGQPAGAGGSVVGTFRMAELVCEALEAAVPAPQAPADPVGPAEQVG